MEKIVFTNGCFDIIHPGHIDLLARAKAFGTRLIVGINSDTSVRSIKGAPRPFLNEEDRKAILLGLKSVDEVRIFSESTPEKLIREIKPEVLVKGGDWATNEIVGAEFVKQNGGEVHSLKLLVGHSTSAIVERFRDEANGEAFHFQESSSTSQTVECSLEEHILLFETLRQNFAPVIRGCADLIVQTLRQGNKILICGNGGSAADAQHIAAEFVGRFETERKGLPAIALTTDTSALTALANDYGFERVFARQVEALAVKGDLLIAISTSGTSPNVIAAVMAARKIGCKTIGFTGAEGKKLASLCDKSFLVPAKRTCRIQEAQIAISHIWCELVDAELAK